MLNNMMTDLLATADVLKELNLLASRLSRLMRQSQAELPYSQRSILLQLLIKPCTIGQLATLENLSAATISRAIDRLEDKNLVWRARDKNDRRIVYVVATREAVKLLRDDSDLLDDRVGEYLAGMDSRELASMHDSLSRLNNLLG